MNTKHIILMACAALLGATQANAQGQDLSILTVNSDAKTAAMGNASVAAEGMYLYNNPAAFFATDKTFTADVAASVFEKAEGADGTFGLYAATAGYKFAKRHAVFAGFRYAGGLKLKGYDVSGNPTKDYQPYNWTIDLGYTYLLGKGFAANLMLDAKVGAIGPQLDYGNKHKTTLPTYFAVGGALSVDVAEKHQVATALSSRYFFQPTEAKLFMLGGGLEYTYDKMISVRAGYEYGDHDLSHVTMGAGFKYQGLRLNGAYNLKTANAGSSYCTIGIGYDF